jgi:hypothetical protein
MAFTLLFLLLLVNAATMAQESPPVQGVCKTAPVCKVLAKEKTWPESKMDGSVRLSGGHFSMVQPPNTLEVVSGWGESVNFVVKLQNGSRLFVSEPGFSELVANGVCAHDEPASILYTEFLFLTPLDAAEPTTPCEKMLRSLAYLHKTSSLFHQANEMYAYSHGNWRVFTSKVKGIDHDTIMIATHTKKPMHYLQLRGDGVSYSTLESLMNNFQIK